MWARRVHAIIYGMSMRSSLEPEQFIDNTGMNTSKNITKPSFLNSCYTCIHNTACRFAEEPRFAYIHDLCFETDCMHLCCLCCSAW